MRVVEGGVNRMQERHKHGDRQTGVREIVVLFSSKSDVFVMFEAEQVPH